MANYTGMTTQALLHIEATLQNDARESRAKGYLTAAAALRSMAQDAHQELVARRNAARATN